MPAVIGPGFEEYPWPNSTTASVKSARRPGGATAGSVTEKVKRRVTDRTRAAGRTVDAPKVDPRYEVGSGEPPLGPLGGASARHPAEEERRLVVTGHSGHTMRRSPWRLLASAPGT
ncbi:HVA1 family protein [Streptomyces sp. NPDC006288]|uniref:HVA1 family protein n=1 Tax=Streptomyces sp. NPDC006288 TaxID=3156743 RepID=UPI0033BD0DF2